MPYIKDKYERNLLDRIVNRYFRLFKKKGRLNYFLFKLAKTSCSNYDDYRNFEGEIQQSLREIYRRQIAPYEDEKIKQNGDVE